MKMVLSPSPGKMQSCFHAGYLSSFCQQRYSLWQNDPDLKLSSGPDSPGLVFHLPQPWTRCWEGISVIGIWLPEFKSRSVSRPSKPAILNILKNDVSRNWLCMWFTEQGTIEWASTSDSRWNLKTEYWIVMIVIWSRLTLTDLNQVTSSLIV